MKTNRIFQTIFTTASIITLLALGWFGAANQQSALAEGGGITVTGEKILVSLSNDTTGWSDDTLYAINPADGSGQTKIFDFHNHPNQSPISSGEIWAPRISADGKQIYFHSEFAYIYTPARRNAFWISSNGATMDQITPGEKSGIWGQTGNSTVSGWVKHGDGTGWANCPVYLEGMDMVYSGADGSFSFSNVPPGNRWLVAYRPALDAFDSTPVLVVSGVNNTGLTLTPNGTYRANFEYPVAYGSRIYYRSSLTAIKWTDTGFSAERDVYTPSSAGCTTTPEVKAFDAAPTSGKLAVIDHQGDGCTDNVGIYTADKDGGNKQAILNMWNDSNWNVSLMPQEIFWSPDESKIAFKGVYQWYNVLVVLDANTGAILGNAYADTNNDILTLYGWNPAGNQLLFSSYNSNTGNAAQKTLSKISVNASGIIGDGSYTLVSAVDLLTNQPVSGATWGNLSDPGGSPTPTPTATATTAPPASLSINHSSGQPGSKFIVSGQNFLTRRPAATLTVSVNGTTVGTINTTSSSFSFTLNTDASAQEGTYLVTVSGSSSAGTSYRLDSNAPLRSDTNGDTLNVPASIGAGHSLYLPVVLK